MAGITAEVAQARLEQYLAAEEAILSGQSYKIGDRELRRADLEMVQKGIQIWNDRASTLGAKGAGIRRVITPRPASSY